MRIAFKPASSEPLSICAIGYRHAISGGKILNESLESCVLEHATTKGDRIVIKVSTPDAFQRSEAAMMRYAATHNILAPKVKGVYDVATTVPIATVMVSELVPGRPLIDVWKDLAASEQASIKHQLREQIGLMRRCTQSFVGRVGHGPTRNVWDSLSPSFCGPFSDEETFNKWCLGRLHAKYLSRWRWRRTLEEQQRQCTSLGRFCLTHGNLSPRNIIVQGSTVTGILSWEHSGFFPEYVEYALAVGLSSGFEEWWIRVLKEILEPCQAELVEFTRMLEQSHQVSANL